MDSLADPPLVTNATSTENACCSAVVCQRESWDSREITGPSRGPLAVSAGIDAANKASNMDNKAESKDLKKLNPNPRFT